MRQMSLIRGTIGRVGRSWGLGAIALASVMWLGASAQAQFTLRFIDVWSESGETVDGMTEAYNFATAESLSDFLPAGTVATDVIQNVPNINYQADGGVDNAFGGNRPYIGRSDREDVINFWEANVTIPAGTYQLGFGSDDGGFLWIEGLEFTNREKVTDGGGSAFGLENSIWFEPGRGVQWSMGTLEVPTETTALLRGGHYERAGGDAIEVAIRDASGFEVPNFDPDNVGGAADIDPELDAWVLLEDGAVGWQINPTQDIQGQVSYAGGKGLVGIYNPPTQPVVTERTNGSGSSQPGLFLQIVPDATISSGLGWVNAINAGLNIDSEGVVPMPSFDTNVYDTVSNVLNTTDAEQVDIEANGSFATYSARAAGEILIESDGTVQFKDGIDDYGYLAVDADGDGAFSGAEVLINDNEWTNFDGANPDSPNGGSPIVATNFTDIDAGGEWRKIEFWMAEGGGGDSMALYWDQNEGVPFPETRGEDAVPEAQVPTSHLRTFQEQAVAAQMQSAVSGHHVLDINVEEVAWDTIVSATPLSFANAVIDINVMDPESLAPGFTVDLVNSGGNLISGNATLNFLNTDAGMWNTDSFLVNGQLVWDADVGGTIPGDYNNNGRVEQADLDLVLLNWNESVDNLPADWINERPTSGIIDQAELDGVLLNWNRTTPGLGAASAVPEPSTLALLLVVAGLGLGLARKRSLAG